LGLKKTSLIQTLQVKMKNATTDGALVDLEIAFRQVTEIAKHSRGKNRELALVAANLMKPLSMF
jgi:hypothetical protein